MKIIIEVEGGCVMGVYCDEPEVHAVIMDRDASENGDEFISSIAVEPTANLEPIDDSICQECGGRGVCSSEHVCQ